jgi:two-component system, chemotaxis family, CheB/CheR fusion protein
MPGLQQRLIPVFHYSLRPQGWLFLGSAENIAGRNDLFDAVEVSARIYRRRGAHRQSVAMPLFVQPLAHAVSEREQSQRNSAIGDRLEAIARRIMERYAPAHVTKPNISRRGFPIVQTRKMMLGRKICFSLTRSRQIRM